MKETQIKELQYQISELSARIKELEAKKSDLSSKLYELQLDANTELFTNTVMEMDEENTLRVWLYSDTRTTPIMDKFAQYRFLLLLNEGRYQNYSIGLIVAHKPRYPFRSFQTNYTMTKLKKDYSYVHLSLSEYNGAFSTLNKQIFNTLSSLSSLDQKIYVFPFQTPVFLGGQNSMNQTGFGDIYYGEELISEGTKYGEVTSYYFIGVQLTQLY